MAKEVVSLNMNIKIEDIKSFTKEQLKVYIRKQVSNLITKEEFLLEEDDFFLFDKGAITSRYVHYKQWNEKVLKEMKEKWKLSEDVMENIKEGEEYFEKLPKHCIIYEGEIEVFKKVSYIRKNIKENYTKFDTEIFIINGKQVKLSNNIKEILV